ncbi:hypothetical protein PFLA_b0828 [Pseudoalteromonas flavipulchra NCIMB 2033 = ATCC BAA-314]|nr:hypothetical protein [Pseudoalteromonas flavipulchra NCIMB 2033 = ATCC BAA-314]
MNLILKGLIMPGSNLNKDQLNIGFISHALLNTCKVNVCCAKKG